MNGRPSSFGPSGNPLLQALSLLLFGLLLVGAVVMGAVILAIVLGVAVIGALAFYVRLWWLARKWRRSAQARAAESGAGRLIQAEYTVVGEGDPGYPNDLGPVDSPASDSRVSAPDDGEFDNSGRMRR
jgi:hypothetical protein